MSNTQATATTTTATTVKPFDINSHKLVEVTGRCAVQANLVANTLHSVFNIAPAVCQFVAKQVQSEECAILNGMEFKTRTGLVTKKATIRKGATGTAIIDETVTQQTLHICEFVRDAEKHGVQIDGATLLNAAVAHYIASVGSRLERGEAKL